MLQVRPRRSDRLELRSRIVDATTRLLSEGGPTAVTTRAVAEAAGIQAPAIYRIFGDKDGLLDAVAEQSLAHYVNDKSRAADTGDPVEDLRAAWHRHVRFGLANPALFTLLTDPERARRSPVAAAGLDVLRARVHRVAAAGRLRVPERRAVDLVHAAGTGAVLTLLAAAVVDRDAHLADTLLDAVLQAVLTDAPTRPSDHASTAAIALRAVAPELLVLSAAERTLFSEWLDRIAAS